MSKFLTIMIALCITMSGAGCSYNTSANNPPPGSERQLASADMGQPADNRRVKTNLLKI